MLLLSQPAASQSTCLYINMPTFWVFPTATNVVSTKKWCVIQQLLVVSHLSLIALILEDSSETMKLKTRDYFEYFISAVSAWKSSSQLDFSLENWTQDFIIMTFTIFSHHFFLFKYILCQYCLCASKFYMQDAYKGHTLNNNGLDWALKFWLQKGDICWLPTLSSCRSNMGEWIVKWEMGRIPILSKEISSIPS